MRALARMKFFSRKFFGDTYAALPPDVRAADGRPKSLGFRFLGLRPQRTGRSPITVLNCPRKVKDLPHIERQSRDKSPKDLQKEFFDHAEKEATDDGITDHSKNIRSDFMVRANFAAITARSSLYAGRSDDRKFV